MLNAFTVDVEDYYQVSAFERDIPRDSWDGYESRVVGSTNRILDLLDRHSTVGTFFILGWVADKYPDLVREIDRRGHEIGSHSYWHRLIYQQTPDEFREDLRRSRDVLESITGRKVDAYRAPSFSIIRRSLWALDILVEEGFRYDSSIFPTIHDRYGIPNARREIHTLHTPSGSLIEFPPSVMRIGRATLPVAGGGYFRLKPYKLTRYCLEHINRRLQRPFMFYIHPWELDTKQPRLAAGSRMARMRHYLNLSRTERKLERLVEKTQFGTMAQVIARTLTDTDSPVAEVAVAT